ncbi:MAG TPA: fused MFS/spermidine synthase, partial [Blastocatellia bacterium]|nr:fused MFS/spermidine synthase [Blastocatellia bacterium]
MAQSTVVSTDRRAATWIILLCFFASGMSGLIYQVVWVRELVLVFGATTFAVSTVLTAFMGGLALGSFVFGRRSSRIKRPLRLYGLIEIGIGLYGLAVPVIFAALPSIYHPFWQWLHLSFLALSVIRFVFAGLVLVLPTALMGATLPVLASYYARDPNRVGLRVGSLYSLNTFGAVCGAFATGFVLIPAFGMMATTAVAAALNILLGLVALSFARNHEVAPPVEEQEEIAPARKAKPAPRKTASGPARAASGRNAERLDRSGVAIVLVCFALSGFIALGYEVIWSRVLALIIGSSVYAFSIMLTTFLVGLALGASLASRIVDRIRRPVMAFALLELGVGATSMIGAYLFNELPYIFMQLYRWLETSAFGLLLLARFLVASLVMIVPTLLLGALFPLVVRIMALSSREQTTGRTVGDAYAVNTVGAIAGSFASGFILIP